MNTITSTLSEYISRLRMFRPNARLYLMTVLITGIAMGIGLLLAPAIAGRIGKIQLVVLSQGLSIPFMVLLGFAPFTVSALAYYVRMALMNMSNPIYQTFVMERVESSERTTVASLTSMVWNSGRAFSPTISGWLQVNYGFTPVFMLAITLYACAIPLYWLFFLRKPKDKTAILVHGD